jgi:hypothetical protein
MATMTFKLNNGEMVWQNKAKNVANDMREMFPLSTAHIVDMPRIKESIKNMEFLEGKSFAFVPVLGLATGGAGVFWDAFMQYIFPWMLDIAKVFCAIKIAQAFYEEKRGGRDSGTGFGSLVTYGKWYLVFWLIPWGVELIDQIGGRMLNELRAGTGVS